MPRLDLLELIANEVERVGRETPDSFCMRVWRLATNCGTIGCAIGHGVAIPEVAATGLFVSSEPRGIGSVLCHIENQPNAKPLSSFAAISYALQMPVDDVFKLFTATPFRETYDGGADNPKSVAARTRAYIAKHKGTDHASRKPSST